MSTHNDNALVIDWTEKKDTFHSPKDKLEELRKTATF